MKTINPNKRTENRRSDSLRTEDILMAKIDLPYIHAFKDRHGKPRAYFRRPGYKGTPLPGLPGSLEFMEAYQAALAGVTAPKRHIGEGRSRSGTVDAVVSSYLNSKNFLRLAKNTR